MSVSSWEFNSPSRHQINERKWLSGRASPCQGEGREFESRLPLQLITGTMGRRSQVDKAGVCKTLIRRFESARRLQVIYRTFVSKFGGV